MAPTNDQRNGYVSKGAVVELPKDPLKRRVVIEKMKAQAETWMRVADRVEDLAERGSLPGDVLRRTVTAGYGFWNRSLVIGSTLGVAAAGVAVSGVQSLVHWGLTQAGYATGGAPLAFWTIPVIAVGGLHGLRATGFLIKNISLRYFSEEATLAKEELKKIRSLVPEKKLSRKVFAEVVKEHTNEIRNRAYGLKNAAAELEANPLIPSPPPSSISGKISAAINDVTKALISEDSKYVGTPVTLVSDSNLGVIGYLTQAGDPTLADEFLRYLEKTNPDKTLPLAPPDSKYFPLNKELHRINSQEDTEARQDALVDLESNIRAAKRIMVEFND